MLTPENKDIFEETIAEFKDKGWEYIFDVIAVRLCKRNIDNIQGRVLLQTSARKAYDKEGVLAHARQYAALFEQHGIPRDRFCIKVPCTGPAMAAAATLNKEGIRTLGTSLFSLAQAIAASQAGCLFISPYYNEIRAHFDPKFRLDLEDPATQHPMSYRIRHILETYKRLHEETGKTQPLIVCASYFTCKEAFATAELGCYSLTLPPAILEELANTPDDSPPSTTPKDQYSFLGPVPERFKKMSTLDPLAAADWDGKLASTEIDYIADIGKALDEANMDPITSTRLKDSLDFFISEDNAAKEAIEKQLSSMA